MSCWLRLSVPCVSDPQPLLSLDCNAERIGHGYHIFSADNVTDKVDDASNFCGQIVQFVAQHRITLEVCLTSNLQTLPELRNDARLHPFGKMLEQRLSVCLNTDNRTVSQTTVTKELRLAADAFQLTRKQLRDIVIGSFKRSFFPRPYAEKRAYVRNIIDLFDRLEAEHPIEAVAAEGPASARASAAKATP